PFAASLDRRQLQRFQNDAYAAAHLHHPHIVPVHEVRAMGSAPFYTMEFIDGVSLAKLLQDQRRRQRSSSRPTCIHAADETVARLEQTRGDEPALADLAWNSKDYVV